MQYCINTRDIEKVVIEFNLMRFEMHFQALRAENREIVVAL